MNAQEFFTISVNEMRQRGHKRAGSSNALNVSFHCMNRAPDGLKCLIGLHIPDELYIVDTENMSVNKLLEKGYLPTLCGVDDRLLLAVRTAHDRTLVPEHFERRITDIAQLFNLKIPAMPSN